LKTKQAESSSTEQKQKKPPGHRHGH
jgi:hypothetical protein